MIKIAKYKNTRHWAVWRNDELVAVVCYKKGAAAIKQLLTKRTDNPATANPTQRQLKK